MRVRQSILLILFGFLALTGCVNYSGLNTHAKPYDATTLSKSQDYKPTTLTSTPTTQPTTNDWWLRFQDPQLNQLEAIALTQSPNIDVAKARIDTAQAQTQAAQSSLLPRVSFDGYLNTQRYTGNSYIPPPFGGHYVYQGYVPINASYDIDFWGKHRQEVAAAVSETEAKSAELAEAKLVLSAEVASSYYQLQSHISQLTLENRLVSKQKMLLSIAQIRTSHGLTSDIPVNQSLTMLQASEINAENQIKLVALSREKLATLMGQNPLTTNIEVKPFHFLSQQTALPKNIPAHLIATRPDVIASRWQVEAKSHDIKVAKARFFPDINIVGYFSYQSIGLNKLFEQNSRDILIQPALSLPLFDGGLLRSAVSQQNAAYDASVNEYNQTLLTALQQVGDGLTRYDTTAQQLNAQQVVVDSLKHNVALVNLQYQRGIVDASQLLSMQISLLNQQLYQLQWQAGQMQNTIAIIQALGGNTDA